MEKKILIIHGPNLNMLGKREPEIYGTETLDTINKKCQELAKELELEVSIHQFNSETEIIEKIQVAEENYDGIIINPAAYSHTSLAIRDALTVCSIPKIEVHLSNIHARETFRQKTLTTAACNAQISGLKGNSYLMALRAIISL